MDKWEKIYKREQKRGLTKKSAVNEPAFIDFIRAQEINTVVEIGTKYGLSAAFFATEAEKVITFDIKDYRKKQGWIWHKAKMLDRIEAHIISSANQIRQILKGRDFDFAFIDGVTPADEIRKVFNIVKRCGRVLIHNAGPDPKFAEAHKFIEENLKPEEYQRVGKQSIYWTRG